MTTLLDVQDLRKRYGTDAQGRVALEGVSLRIARGELVAVVGTSGSGKSTLLNVLGTLDRDFEGEVTLDGHRVRELPDRAVAALRHRLLGFVFQSFHLVPTWTVRHNVGLPASFAPARVPDLDARIDAVLARVGLPGCSEEYPTALSGGQRQRVAIARALLLRPSLLLCDEPTGSLDATTGQAILSLFQALHHEEGLTIVLVTHEERVTAIADRVVHLEDGHIVSDRQLAPNSSASDPDRSTRTVVTLTRLAALSGLVAGDLRRSLRTFSVAALGIAVGIATLSFFLALSTGVRTVVLGRIFPIDQVEVIPPETSVGTVLSLLGSRPPGIDPGTVQDLRRSPGVRSVVPRMRLAFPSSGRGGRAVFGRDIGAGEIPADGVDPAAIRPDLAPGTDFEDPELRSSHQACSPTVACPAGEYCQYPAMLPANPPPDAPPPAGTCSRPVPAVVSPYLIEVFNGAIAPAHRLPRVGALLLRQAQGLVMEWDLGRAALGAASQGRPRRVYLKIVGISPRAIDLGVTVPLDVARRLNREYAGPTLARNYTSVAVYLRSAADLTRVGARVRTLSLEIRTSGAEQMGLLVTAITAILSLTSILTVIVASLNIAHAFFTLIAERRGEIGLMRALGASQGDIRAIVLAQALVMGALASVAGLALARLAAWGCNHVANTQLPAFPFKPDNWFDFTTGAGLVTLAFGIGACVLSALAPASRAARVEPASALSSGV